jgi:hypothetical protein
MSFVPTEKVISLQPETMYFAFFSSETIGIRFFWRNHFASRLPTIDGAGV